MIYLIPGLGADHKVFKNLNLHPHPYKVINWLDPIAGESLSTYAQRLGNHFFDPKDEIIIVGLSMGGMIVKEMMEHFPVKKAFIISSIQLSKDFSIPIKIARALKLHKLFPVTRVKQLNHLSANYFFSVKDDISKKALHKTIDETDPAFLDWAIDAILRWESKKVIPEIVHIHGNRDRIFPIKSISSGNIITIEGGGHWMVVERASEINKHILHHLAI